LRGDNGLEFVAGAVKEWIKSWGVLTHYIDPGRPWQDACGKTFNDKFQDECLNLEWFPRVAEARVIACRWR
jgi:putative transposase